ncbi:MAG: SUMF1/EgtB/PvdO family nonheme iron enzyme [Parachlamydiales bacterium]|nr:SUMF1/EgtB/PvdO family nonheme iron enzyme [Parachlamydiales bacterium]
MEHLGDYTILKKLGEGPFGEVFLAEHRFIKRQFALKLLPEEICANALFMRRFESEISEIAALDHPNIAKIHNISSANDRFFIVTDPQVDSLGQTMHLERYLELKGKGLAEEDYLQLLGQVASALDYAHEAGLTHGALKLTNILVAPDEKGVRLLLSDFGLTRLIGEKICLIRLCQKMAQNFPSSPFIRSFAFLSPEQKMAEGEISEKVDAYAFGILAYYFLFRKIPEGCFDLPSRGLPDLTQNWDLLISRCLQTNANIRPQKLTGAMKEYLPAPKAILKEMLHLSEAEPKPDAGQQMAFELEASEPAVPVEPPKPVLKPQEIARPEFEPDPGAIFQRETHVSHYTPTKVEAPEIEPILTEMIVVPGGTYVRGSSEGARDEMPRHKVNLVSFALDIHPVTNDQFVRFLQAMGGEKDHNNNDIIRLRDSRIKRSGGKLIIESGYAKHPVVGVTWYGAIAYAKWIGKRLPTEAEWEAASTAGRDTIYPSGAEIERSQANFFSSDTTAVMSYPPNPFGLYDMAGNVYEWCQDWYAYNYYDASAVEPDNPHGPPQGVYRVLRGGCWKSLKDDLRCSHRHRNNPGAVNGTYGFRCAADVS